LIDSELRSRLGRVERALVALTRYILEDERIAERELRLVFEELLRLHQPAAGLQTSGAIVKVITP
jgi:hypothetical protein